jgi:hypothetical protein
MGRRYFKVIQGVKTLAVVNTPEAFLISALTNLPEGSKVYIVTADMDLNQLNLDANNAYAYACMKKGDQSSSTNTRPNAPGYVPGTAVEMYRVAQSHFSGGNPGKTRLPAGMCEVPVTDGTASITIAISQTGATASLQQVYYHATLFVIEP